MRLLISACDAAAAFHAIQVAKSAHADKRFDVHVVAQNPAADIFSRGGLPHTTFDLSRAESPVSSEGEALLEAARRLVEDVRPDALLCGLSTPFDGGIDEALLAVRSCSAFLLQDFWGEQNDFFGRAADILLVLDEYAADLSLERCSGRPIVIGSTRHANYRTLPFKLWRDEFRAKANISAEANVVGLFGQALHRNPGYMRTVVAWGRAMRSTERPLEAVYRPHPREGPADVESIQVLLRTMGINVRISDCSVSVEQSLAACDVVCTLFSNCLYDAAFINKFSDEPLFTPMALMFDRDIVNYYQEKVGFEQIPYLKADLAYPVLSERELAVALDDALQLETRQRFWLAAQNNLQDCEMAVSLALDEIAKVRILGSARPV